MRIKLSGLTVILAGLLAGCIATPGKNDLIAQGMQTKLSVKGDHKVIAQCITDILDHEPWGLFDMPAPVTRAMQSPDGTSTDLVSSSSSGILIWMADLGQTSPDETSIVLTTRREDNPYLSSHYLFDKLRKAITECEEKRG